jgi:ribonuclease PH
VAVDLRLLGERTVIIDCDVLQADGGTRTAAITGGYVALAIALRKLIKGGLLPASVLRTQVAAISVGVLQDEPLLDLTYEEDYQAQVDFNLVMTAEREYVEVQGTGEGGPFSRQMMDRLLDLAQKGIEELLAAQKEALKGY